ncbi:MAG: AEC family transporter [Clostridiales bacterium]|nr:AEC family transporter [Clostridiales bacterium]
MLSNILTVAQQVLILFILIGVGFAANKTKIISEEAIKGVTNLMLYIVTPAVIINSFNRPLDTQMMKGLVIVFAAAVFAHIINIVAATALIHDKEKGRERIFKLSMVFSNCGYMSFPLQEAILGSDGVFYGAAYVAVFNIIVWTWGESLMRGSFKFSLKKIILNPGIIGTLVGLVIFFGSVPVPSVIGNPIGYLADLNTPVAMIIIGYHLANASLKIRGKNEYITMLYRLIISPVILAAALLLCSVKGDILIVCTIAASAPVAALVTMFATKFEADTRLAAGLASLTTVISIITMPVIVGMVQFFG